MIKQCECSKTSNAYQEWLDELVKDPEQAELYLEEHIKSGDVELAMIVMRDIIEAERRKFSARLDALEKCADELKERIAALEQVQVTRQEFDDLKARVDGLEKALRRGLAEVIVRI